MSGRRPDHFNDNNLEAKLLGVLRSVTSMVGVTEVAIEHKLGYKPKIVIPVVDGTVGSVPATTGDVFVTKASTSKYLYVKSSVATNPVRVYFG